MANIFSLFHFSNSSIPDSKLTKNIRRAFENIIPDNDTNDDIFDPNKDSLTRFSFSSTDSDYFFTEQNWGIDIEAETQREYDSLIIDQSKEKTPETLSHSSSILSKILEDQILKEWLDTCGEGGSQEREPTPMTLVELDSDDTLSVLSDRDRVDEDFDKDDLDYNEESGQEINDIPVENEPVQDVEKFEGKEDSSSVIQESIPEKRPKKKKRPSRLLREITSLDNSPLGDKYPETSQGK